MPGWTLKSQSPFSMSTMTSSGWWWRSCESWWFRESSSLEFERAWSEDPLPRNSFAAIIPLTMSSHSKAILVFWYNSFDIVSGSCVSDWSEHGSSRRHALMMAYTLERIYFAVIEYMVYSILKKLSVIQLMFDMDLTKRVPLQFWIVEMNSICEESRWDSRRNSALARIPCKGLLNSSVNVSWILSRSCFFNLSYEKCCWWSQTSSC